MTINLIATDNQSGAIYTLNITNVPIRAIIHMAKDLESTDCEVESIFVRN